MSSISIEVDIDIDEIISNISNKKLVDVFLDRRLSLPDYIALPGRSFANVKCHLLDNSEKITIIRNMFNLNHLSTFEDICDELKKITN
jgi:hypothetical protein